MANMTSNKHFNTYKEGLDLEFLRAYCMEHGERRMKERGCFKYMAHNDEESKDYCTGFAFEGKFVPDFHYCLDGDVSEVFLK